MKSLLSLLLLGSTALADDYFALYASTNNGLVNTLKFFPSTHKILSMQNVTECGQYPGLAIDRVNNKVYCSDDAPSWPPPTGPKAGIIEYPIITGFKLADGALNIQEKVLVNLPGHEYGVMFGKDNGFITILNKQGKHPLKDNRPIFQTFALPLKKDSKPVQELTFLTQDDVALRNPKVFREPESETILVFSGSTVHLLAINDAEGGHLTECPSVNLGGDRKILAVSSNRVGDGDGIVYALDKHKTILALRVRRNPLDKRFTSDGSSSEKRSAVRGSTVHAPQTSCPTVEVVDEFQPSLGSTALKPSYELRTVFTIDNRDVYIAVNNDGDHHIIHMQFDKASLSESNQDPGVSSTFVRRQRKTRQKRSAGASGDSKTARYVSHTKVHADPVVLKVSPDRNFMAIGGFGPANELVIVKRDPKTGQLGEKVAFLQLGESAAIYYGIRNIVWGSLYKES